MCLWCGERRQPASDADGVEMGSFYRITFSMLPRRIGEKCGAVFIRRWQNFLIFGFLPQSLTAYLYHLLLLGYTSHFVWTSFVHIPNPCVEKLASLLDGRNLPTSLVTSRTSYLSAILLGSLARSAFFATDASIASLWAAHRHCSHDDCNLFFILQAFED